MGRSTKKKGVRSTAGRARAHVVECILRGRMQHGAVFMDTTPPSPSLRPSPPLPAAATGASPPMQHAAHWSATPALTGQFEHT